MLWPRIQQTHGNEHNNEICGNCSYTCWNIISKLVLISFRCTQRTECSNAESPHRWLPYSGQKCTSILQVLPEQVQMSPSNPILVSTLLLMMSSICVMPFSDRIFLISVVCDVCKYCFKFQTIYVHLVSEVHFTSLPWCLATTDTKFLDL